MSKSRQADAETEVFLRFLGGWRPYAWLAGFCVLLYCQTLFFDLTLLDDNVYLLDKLGFLLDWSNISELFRKSSFLEPSGGVYYRPVLILSKMLDAQLGGRSLAVFHFSNIVFHAASCGLFFSLLTRFASRERSFFLALLFCAHPLLAQAVAWMPGRTDSLTAVFILSSFLAFLDFISGARTRTYLLHVAFFILGLLTKELAVVLPPICATYAWMTGRPIDWRRKIFLAFGWACPLLAWVLVRRAVLGSGAAYTAVSAIDSIWRNQPAALVYLGKMVLPFRLCPYPIMKDAPIIEGCAAATLLAAAALVFPPRKWRLSLWAAAWFLGFLLPSFVYPPSSITPVFFEYRAYLPLMGLIIFLSQLEWRGARPILVGCGLLLFFCARTLANSRNYQDGRACWAKAVACSPSSAFAHKQLGVVRYFERDLDEAEREYRKALEINPREPLAYNNLGVISADRGQLEEAATRYLAELRINPDYDNALANLGLVYYRTGKTREAEALWKRTLEVNPEHADARRYLSLLGNAGAKRGP